MCGGVVRAKSKRTLGPFLSNNPNQQQNLPTTSCNIRDIKPVEPIKGSYFWKFNKFNPLASASIHFLLVKICKNPVFGVAKLQEPNLVPTQHTEIDIETSSQNRANNAPKSSQQRTEIDLEPKLSQKWRNSFVELSKKPLHTIRI